MVEFSWLNDIQGVGGGGGGGVHRGGSRGDHSKTGPVAEKGCNVEVHCIELFLFSTAVKGLVYIYITNHHHDHL